MKRATLNVGLMPGEHTRRRLPLATGVDARIQRALGWAYLVFPGMVRFHLRQGSESHEPFLILEGDVPEYRPQFRQYVLALAKATEQDCIALQVHDPATGVREPGQLIGPHTTDWEPFQSKLFHTLT